MDPGWEIRTDFWSEILDPPRLGQLDGFLVKKHESELLGEVDGDMVGRSERGCCLVKQTGTVLVKCGMDDGLSQWTVGCLEVTKPRLIAHFTETPALKDDICC